MSYGSMEPRGVDEDKEKETRLEEQEAELDYDVLVETIGEFGWFQKLTCALLWVPAAVGGIHVLMYSFTGEFFGGNLVITAVTGGHFIGWINGFGKLISRKLLYLENYKC